jgi:hypothetical protein
MSASGDFAMTASRSELSSSRAARDAFNTSAEKSLATSMAAQSAAARPTSFHPAATRSALPVPANVLPTIWCIWMAAPRSSLVASRRRSRSRFSIRNCEQKYAHNSREQAGMACVPSSDPFVKYRPSKTASASEAYSHEGANTAFPASPPRWRAHGPHLQTRSDSNRPGVLPDHLRVHRAVPPRYLSCRRNRNPGTAPREQRSCISNLLHRPAQPM